MSNEEVGFMTNTSAPVQEAKAASHNIPEVNTTKETYAYFKGQIVPMSEAKVSVATHAMHYGTSCFEGIRAYWNPQKEQMYILKMKEHYERFYNSMKVLMMHPDETIDDLCRITVDLVAKHNHRENVYIRPLAYKSSCTIKLTLSSLDDEITIFTFPMNNYVDIEAGLNVCTSSWRRSNSNAMPVRAKVGGGYVNSTLAIDDAAAAGFDEAIFLTHDGYVSEGSSCNVFLVRNGKLVTPAVSEDILEGVTRNTLIEVAKDELGLTVEERRVDRTELYAAEEVFFTGTGVQLSPVTRVDRRIVGNGKPGKITLDLQKIYMDAVRGNNPKYMDWLTPVY